MNTTLRFGSIAEAVSVFIHRDCVPATSDGRNVNACEDYDRQWVAAPWLAVRPRGPTSSGWVV